MPAYSLPMPLSGLAPIVPEGYECYSKSCSILITLVHFWQHSSPSGHQKKNPSPPYVPGTCARTLSGLASSARASDRVLSASNEGGSWRVSEGCQSKRQ